MTTLPMAPIPVPPEAAANRLACRAIRIGPPPGVSDDDCSTLECLAGLHESGLPMIAAYWRPTPEQLTTLQAGGFIEHIQYARRLTMHSMTVWAAAPDEPDLVDVEGCGWIDCQTEGDHEHDADSTWINHGDRQAGEVHVHVRADGTVEISEAAIAQLLTDAGWERAR